MTLEKLAADLNAILAARPDLADKPVRIDPTANSGYAGYVCGLNADGNGPVNEISAEAAEIMIAALPSEFLGG